jgi:hypothetical protein
MAFFIWNQQVGEPYQFKAASFASIDLHVEVANDVSSASKTLYNQHELQQLSTTIGGKLIVVYGIFFLDFFHDIISIHFDINELNDQIKENIWRGTKYNKALCNIFLCKLYVCVCVCVCRMIAL